LGAKPRRTAYASPWQNGVAERWIGTLRRELLDHVVILGRQHLIQLVNAYIRYYHEERCHLGLGRNTPHLRLVTPRPSADAKVVALPRVGALHHRYVWREAA
jgi:transposase InsO family protein